jgi:hypothetical protein
MRQLVRLTAVSLALICSFGCKSAYYGTWEKLGWAKRDILVDRVKEARDDQNAAKEQFKTTLEQFQQITGFQGGDLEAKYKKLNSAYESSQSSADAVSKRIKSVDTVANDMFNEWKEELKQYDNPKLRESSEQKLNDTKQRYAQLIAAMRKSEASMSPVLKAFHDQVLYLKHNLNAAAIASLQTTASEIDADVQKLIKDMEASIAEANSFISQMKT